MKRSRFSRVLAFAVFLALLPAVQAGTAKTRDASCGQDSVLVWPVSRTGPLLESEVVANGLDGDVRARFPLERPASAVYSAVGARAVVLQHPDSASIVDIGAGTVTTLDTDEVSFGHPANGGPVPGLSSFVLLGREFGQFYLVDMESAQSYDLNAGINGKDAYGVTISANNRYVAVTTTNFLFLGQTTRPDVLGLVHPGAGLQNPVFVADSSMLMFIASDYAAGTAQLLKADLSTLQVSAIEEILPGTGVRGLHQVDDRSVAYSVAGSVVVTDVVTGASAAYHVGNPGPEIAAASPDGRQILYGTASDESGSDEEIKLWFLLELETGASTHLDLLDGYVPHALVSPTKWLLFQGAEQPSPDFAIANLETGEHSIVFSTNEAPGGARWLETARDGASALFEVENGEATLIWLLDFASASLTKLNDIEGQATVSYSPDGCFVAIGDFHPTPDLRTAEITIHNVDGEIVSTIPDAVLLGWASAS